MPHILIVEARFYENIADALLAQAEQALSHAGAKLSRVSVPGALEIPAAIAMAAQTGTYDGYVALGCVIRGETGHYDIVASESARGLMELSVVKGLAIGNGILTVEDGAQAWARIDGSVGRKGIEASAAVLQLLALAKQWELRK